MFETDIMLQIMKTILFMGDSEAGIFSVALKRLEERFDISVRVNARGGRSLVEVPDYLTEELLEGVDVLVLFGLTSFAWRRIPLEGASRTWLITDNPEANWGNIPKVMQDITVRCRRYRRNIQIFLTLPSVKNIRQYNLKKLTEGGSSQASQLMDQHAYFSREYLAAQARRIYMQALRLKDDEYSWNGKNVVMMNHMLNHYFRQYTSCPTHQASHSRFLRGQAEEFMCPELVYDGIHYTTLGAELFLEAISHYYRWLRLKLGASPPMIAPVGPVALTPPRVKVSAPVNTSSPIPPLTTTTTVSESPSVKMSSDIVSEEYTSTLAEKTNNNETQDVILIDLDSPITSVPVDDDGQTFQGFEISRIFDDSFEDPWSSPCGSYSTTTPTRANTRGRTFIGSSSGSLLETLSITNSSSLGTMGMHVRTTENASDISGEPVVESATADDVSLNLAEERGLWFYVKGIERCLVPTRASNARRQLVLKTAQDMLQALIEGREYSLP